MVRGVKVWQRAANPPLRKRVWRKAIAERRSHEILEIDKFLDSVRPALVIAQSGAALPPITVVELCSAKEIPFVTIGQANYEGYWCEDDLAERYRRALAAALRCYFVSRANLQLTEKQIGCELSNAEIVRNPFNVDYNASVPWPQDANNEVRFACVGRLDPRAKGQDILLEALAQPAWMNRRWSLTFYGDGPMRNSIERLIDRLNLVSRVTLAGYVSPVERIWAENHALVMPSRFEGLPLAMIEAMLCARPVVATDVAGHSEIIADGVTGFLAGAPTASSFALALERFWGRRNELEQMGEAAAESIRNYVPRDPAKVFSEKIKQLLGKQ